MTKIFSFSRLGFSLLLILFFASGKALADPPNQDQDQDQNQDHAPPATEDHSSDFSITTSLTWINAGSWTSLRDTPNNPGNSVLAISSLQAISELRPDLKLETPRYRLILRPDFRHNPFRTEAQGAAVTTWDQTRFQFNDLYVQWNISDPLSLTYGLQNFQWGPAESISPSNPIFRDTIQKKDILFVVRGRHLLRMNISPRNDWSIVLLGELTGNGDPELDFGQPFQTKALVKTEYNWSSGADYAGWVLGAIRSQGVWIGEYLNLTLAEGLTVYADLAHQKGPPAGLLQERRAPGADASDMTPTHGPADEETLYTKAVGGIRYAFVNGADLRLEYIHDNPAYGMREFPGQKFLYFSLRVPDFLGEKDLTLLTRYLHSLADHSGSAYATAERAISDAGVLFGAGGFSHGSPTDELANSAAYLLMAGYRHTW